MSPAWLEFLVHIGEPELVRPVTPTPREFKYLSNIDDQAGLRNHIPFVHLYTPNSATRSKDPASAIKQALSKALVQYYPLAGWLRNADKGKLVVQCNGEGVIFREADADVTLARLRKNNGGLRPPFPQFDRLLVDDVWGSFFITDSPLLRIQVTRLACGGFVLAYTFNHCACDAFGAFQFLTVVAELCRNIDQSTTTITPSWEKEILKPRSPPRISYPQPKYVLDHPTDTYPATETDFKSLAQTSVFFSHADISVLKSQINSQRCPTFDALASCLWTARAPTLINPDADMKLLFPIDTRFRYKPHLPKGYYGTAVVFPCAFTKASELIEKPLCYAAGLVSEVKRGVTNDEYRASVLDFIEVNGRRGFCNEGAFVVSDMSLLMFADADFGWGQGVYGGPSRAGSGLVPGIVTSVIGYRNEEGVDGVLALVSLPPEAFERFHHEVRKDIDVFVPIVAISAL